MPSVESPKAPPKVSPIVIPQTPPKEAPKSPHKTPGSPKPPLSPKPSSVRRQAASPKVPPKTPEKPPLDPLIVSGVVEDIITDVITSATTEPSVPAVVLAAIDDIMNEADDDVPPPRPPKSHEVETQETSMIITDEIDIDEPPHKSKPAMNGQQKDKVINGHIATGSPQDRTRQPQKLDLKLAQQDRRHKPGVRTPTTPQTPTDSGFSSIGDMPQRAVVMRTKDQNLNMDGNSTLTKQVRLWGGHEDVTVRALSQCNGHLSWYKDFRYKDKTVMRISYLYYENSCVGKIRADSRFAPSQWETALFCNNVSHWLGASLESALQDACIVRGSLISDKNKNTQESYNNMVNFL